MGIAAVVAVAALVGLLPNSVVAAVIGPALPQTLPPDMNGYYGESKVASAMASMVPISVKTNGKDPWSSVVTLCRLDMARRREEPSSLPMFRFWVKASRCDAGGHAQPDAVGATTTMTLRALHIWMERTEEDWIRSFGGATTDGRGLWRPTGMVLHEARVGSTLVANMLQKLPGAVVYSESAPPADILFRAPHWTRQQRVEALRVVVRAMGRVAGAQHLFFKFQSAVTGSAGVLHEAFPDSPFIFLKRDPVEVMSSLLGTLEDAMRRGTDTGRAVSGRNTPCTRTIRAPPEGMAPALGFKSDEELKLQGREAYCAAHVGFVEYNALTVLKAAAEQAESGKGIGVGAAVDYKDLPGVVPRVVRELFDVELAEPDEEAMMSVSKTYSKGTNPRSRSNANPTGEFVPDSEKKLATAPPELKEAADRLIAPRRPELEAFDLDKAIKLRTSPTAGRAEAQELTADEWKKRVEELQANAGGSTASQEESVPMPKAGSLVSMGKVDGENTITLGPKDDASTAQPYPKLFPLPDILDAWSVDEPRVPDSYGKYASLRVFDFTDSDEVEVARQYREAEVPFVARGVPNLMRLNKEWTDDFLAEKIGGNRHTEVSPTNHFMYYHRGSSQVRRGEYTPVTRDTRKSYRAWINHARDVEKKVLKDGANNREVEHWYFRATGKHVRAKGLRGGQGQDAFIGQGFDIFDGTRPDNGGKDDIAKSDFFIIDPHGQRGIHCRFGEAGILAESHYDGGRNFITMVRGAKRYIISPPSECPNYNLLRDGPSARHSATDWGDPEDYRSTLRDAKAAEVIIEAGDALYVPSFWFHTPISIRTNIQCNTRSGSPPEGGKDIESCGFRIQVTEGDSKRTPSPRTVAPEVLPPTPAPVPATE